jgi:hypothetical protein
MTNTTLQAYLGYRDAPAAIEWLGRAFGFTATMTIPDGHGGVAHAELRLGDAVVADGGVHLVGRRLLRGAGARVAGSLAGWERAHRRAAPARRRSGRLPTGVRQRVAGRSRTG